VPKLKTNRSARKRFRLTGTGKIKRRKAYARHLLSKKSSTRKRRLGRSALVHRVDAKRVRRLINA
jgi:large subunit ribosomal protein L35